MRIECLPHDTAIAMAEQLPFAWITEFSRIYYGPTPETLNSNEWIEAHFFGPKQELRFMDMDATLFTQEDNDLFIDETVNLVAAAAMDDPGENHKVQIRKYIQTDEDGQAHIVAVRLMAEEDA